MRFEQKEHLRRAGGNKGVEKAEATTDRRMSREGKRGVHEICKRWGRIW
jgi:hypothetical protein